MELSHHDPVYDMFWIQSRSGNECCSVSTDGQMLWWDVRKVTAGPTDSMMLSTPQDPSFVYGGTAMEYKSDAGATRYLVGTEQGRALLVDRKAKKDAVSQTAVKAVYGLEGGKHNGPIYSIQRNPQNLKYFLTVGDWTAKIWMEDLKNPIMQTKYDASYLTAGCWSPTRPGVFFTTKADGTLDIWDLVHKHNDPVFSTKVGESSLTAIKVQNQGKLIALGSQDGTTTIVEISSNLCNMQANEKAHMAQMLERETKREKNLEIRALQKRRDGRAAELELRQQNNDMTDEDKAKLRAVLQKVESDFYVEINELSNGPAIAKLDTALTADSGPLSSSGDGNKETEAGDAANDAANASLVSQRGNQAGEALSISVSCRDLPRADWASKCDPLTAMFVKNATGEFIYLDQTEWMKNNPDPNFRKTLNIGAYNSSEDKMLKFSVYDCKTDDLDEDDRMGSVTVSLNHLLSTPGKEYRMKLQKMPDEANEQNGTIILRVNNTSTSENGGASSWEDSSLGGQSWGGMQEAAAASSSSTTGAGSGAADDADDDDGRFVL